MAFKSFDDTPLSKKKTTIPKKNWNDPDIVNTELTLPKYYNTLNPVFGELQGQFKRSMWGIMNHCDNATQKKQLNEMVQFLDELTRSTKDFLEKWENAHEENTEDD